ncbi:hypothetical protein [Hydrogenophaga sp.]|uniref:hypothetical protein n=1 Tax=Hydrogenophaga sp. TaxID=1904254 RepID=UPI00286D8275|nr:hypothetical protein [Hydrogenophaga sp.]
MNSNVLSQAIGLHDIAKKMHAIARSVKHLAVAVGLLVTMYAVNRGEFAFGFAVFVTSAVLAWALYLLNRHFLSRVIALSYHLIVSNKYPVAD